MPTRRLRHQLPLLLTALLLLLPTAARAATNVHSEVSQTKVVLGSNIEYKIRISSDQSPVTSGRIDNFQLPALSGLRFQAQRPYESTTQQFVNNQRNFSLELTWRLNAIQPGNASIGPASFQYEGQAFQTEAHNIQVVQSQEEALPEALRSGDILAAQTSDPDIQRQLHGRLFARLEISDPNPFLKQTIQLSCKVYVDGIEQAIASPAWNPPDFEGFFAESLDLQNLRFTRETLSGKTYSVVEIARYYLTPTRAGTLEIPASVAQCAVEVRDSSNRRQSFEERFFGMSPFTRNRQLPVQLPLIATPINVQPLPAEGRPDSFQGAVGEFDFRAEVDRKSMSQDDLLTLRLSVTGQGYLGAIDQPALPKLQSWTEAGSDSQLQSTGELASYGGSKQFEILLRPETNGQLQIPRIDYAIFSPQQNRYIEQSAGPFQVNVAPGKAGQLLVRGPDQSLQSLATNSAESPRVLSEQLAYIQTQPPRFEKAAAPLQQQAWFWYWQALPATLILLATGARLGIDYRRRHSDTLRVRAAGAHARRELRSARQALRAGDHQRFHESLADALRRYLGAKLGRPPAGLTLEEIETRCRQQGATPEDAATAARLVEQAEQARYLPTGAQAEGARQQLDAADELLKKLDRSLKGKPHA